MAGAILGFFVSLLVPPRYVGMTTVRFADSEMTPAGLTSRLFAPERLTQVIHGESNLKEMLTMYRIDEVSDMVTRSAKVTAAPGGLAVSYEDDNAERALSIDRELAVAAIRLSSKPAVIVNGPRTERTGATPLAAGGLGLGAGAVLGLLIWGLHAAGPTAAEPAEPG